VTAATGPQGAPVVAEVVRGGLVESRHHGMVVAVGSDGSRMLEIGDVDGLMYARSSLKPLQALGMLDAGWDPGDDEQVAVAAASHSGEPMHVDVVRRILDSAGLEPDALDNTADLPLDTAAAHALLRAGEGPSRLHQNCSGKHAAMLATCVTNGWPTAGYRDPGHPLQVAIRHTVERCTGEDVAGVTVDGCGAPLFATSLAGLATAFAAIAQSRVADAMRAHPQLVGGTGRDVTALMRGVDGLVAKDGAEGVYAAALTDGRAAAVKIEDGGGRARTPVLVGALRALGVDSPAFDALATVPVLGHGERVGEVRAVSVRGSAR
jgi:L-asparaginase II